MNAIANTTETEEVLDGSAGTEGEGDVLGGLSTPEIKLPPRNPEAHQGTVVAVTPESYDSGAHAILITLLSANTGAEYKYPVFVPLAAYDNPYITSQEISKLPAPEGKVQTPKEQWGRAKEQFEGLLRLAIAQGREIPRDRAASFEEFVATIDQVCAGIDVVFRLATEKNAEPQFKNVLKPKGIYAPETASNPKMFKTPTIRKWEAAEGEEAQQTS